MKFKTPVVFALGALVLSQAAQAQFAKPEDAIKYRKNALYVMQQHYARIGAMATGRAPFDAKVAQDNAEVALYMARLPWAGFVEGTDKGDTKAKPEIWKEMDKFKEGSDKMVAEMQKLVAATRTGNLDNIKASFNATSGSCKACHDNYREK